MADLVYGSNLHMQVISTMQRIFFSTPIVKGSDTIIKMWVAQNEYESSQVALHSEQEVTISRVESTDLVNELNNNILEARNFSYHFPAYVYYINPCCRTRWCGPRMVSRPF